MQSAADSLISHHQVSKEAPVKNDKVNAELHGTMQQRLGIKAWNEMKHQIQRMLGPLESNLN